MFRICKFCGLQLPVTARPNREYCIKGKCKRLAWDKSVKINRRQERAKSDAEIFRQKRWESTVERLHAFAPPSMCGYRVIIKKKFGVRVIMPQPGSAWHLTFEGTRSPGDFYQLFPIAERPRVPKDGEYHFIYVDYYGKPCDEHAHWVDFFTGCRMSVPSGKSRTTGPTPGRESVDLL